MAQTQKIAKKLTGEAAKVSRQKKIIQQLKKKENWMKWALVASLIVILLLLLFIGYVTDWTTGLRKDTATTPISTDLDSSKTGAGSDTGTSGSGSNGSGGNTGGSGGVGGAGSAGGSGTDTNTSTTERSSSSDTSSTTTNNNSTTNNNTTTQESVLTQLYNQTGAGDSIDEVISQAQSLGISVDCTDTLLVKECTFTAGGESFSTKSVSGLVTSVLGL